MEFLTFIRPCGNFTQTPLSATENPAKKIRYFEEAQYRTIWACQNLEFGNRGMPDAKRLKGKLELLRDHR